MPLDNTYLWHDRQHVTVDELPSLVSSIVESLNSDTSVREELNRRHLGLYGALPMSPTSTAMVTKDVLNSAPRLTWNVVQSVIDTATSFIGTHVPKIKFLTVGGDFSTKEKAENLTYFCQGIFHHEKVYEIATEVFKDSCIFGTGFIKIWADMDSDKPRIMVERVFPNEIVVDDREALYGKPQNLYQSKTVPRASLIAKFPDKELEIMQAARLGDDSVLNSVFGDTITVIEAWHLGAPGNSYKGGRHTITTSNSVLLDEEWNKPRFPIIPFRYNNRPLGYYGQGIAEMLTGVQIEINLILQKIQKLMKLATSKVFVNSTTRINKNSLNNEDWGVVEYTGDKSPVFATVRAFDSQYAQQLELLYQKAFELSGVSQLSAQSKKPTGLDSGKAIREFEDIQTRRFALVAQNWDSFFISVAESVIDCAKEISEAGKKSYEILARTPSGVQSISWSQINLDRDKFVIQPWAVPMLTGSPAYQLQSLLEMAQNDPSVGVLLLPYIEHPDVKEVLAIATSPTNAILKIGTQIAAGRDVAPPEPAIITPEGMKIMKNLYIKAMVEDQPEDILDKYRIWISQATAIIDAQMKEEQLKQQQTQPNIQPGGGLLPPQQPATPPPAPIDQNLAAMNLSQK